MNHIELERPEYEPNTPAMLVCEICMSKIQSPKNKIPVAAKKDVIAIAIIISLSRRRFIIITS
jgi:hypothetical protein